MITIFGIKNCDTMKKAFDWLNNNHINYHFHDYKKESVTEKQLSIFMECFNIETLINTKGTTFKKLIPEIQQQLLQNPYDNIPIIIAQPSMLKRPIVIGTPKPLIGFKPVEWEGVFSSQ
jgi:arsenate reductase (glutaredoxin)